MSAGLYGVACMQTFFYYVHYPHDSSRMKYFVGAVWVFNTINSALLFSGVYKYIIATLLDPTAISQQIPELALQILSAAPISMPTQGFFVYRIYIFGGRNLVAPILWGSQMIVQIVIAILYVARSLYTSNGHVQSVSFTVLDTTFFKDTIIVALTLAAIVDVLIAISMTYLLFKRRAVAGFESSAHILQRLTVFAVNTGIWTASFAVLSAILLRALPSTNGLYLVFSVPLPAIYCNTLLANLNARTYIRGGTTSHELVVMSGGGMSGGTRTDTRDVKVSPSTPLNIRKETEVVTFTDVNRVTTPEDCI